MINEEHTDETTIGDVLDVLDSVLEDGKYSSTTIIPLRIAVGKIMRETTDRNANWRLVPLKNINLEARISLFRDRTNGACSERTVYAYRTRFERAIEIFEREKKLQRRWLESEFKAVFSRTPEVRFDTLNRGVLLEGRTQDTGTIKSDAEEMIGVIREDYSCVFREDLLKEISNKDFVEKNSIYPIVFGQNRKAFIILPEAVTENEEKKIRNRLDLALRINSRKEQWTHSLFKDQ